MLLRLSLIGLIFAGGICAQVSTGTITGTVADSSGAIVANARVQVINTDTGLTRSLTTETTGIYRATLLPPGPYKVEATREGFQIQSKVGLVLSIDQTLTVNFELTPGEVKQAVTVVARSEQLVQAATSNLGQVIEETQVRDLPLNGRNFQQLISLNTGTVPGPQGQFTSQSFHINGGRGEGNAFLVDGVDTSNSYSDPVRVNPSLESIGEFKILTNNYTAEYGRSVGGVINVRLKNGTNELHGTLFEFMRNKVLDARNFFATTRPPFNFNQFGGSLGGPIKRDKLFFFGDYQGSRVRFSGVPSFSNVAPTATSAPALLVVPDADTRRGVFTSRLPATVIYDPTSSPRIPFPNNVIPPSQIDAPVAKMMSLLPLPNRPGPFNFLAALPSSFRGDSFDNRIDYQINEKNSLNGSFSFNSVDGKTAPPFGPVNGHLITSDFPHNQTRRVAVNYTHVFSPTTVNELVAGYSRDRWFGPPTDGHQFVPDLGIRFINTSAGDTRTSGYPLMMIPGEASVFGGPAGAPFEHVTNNPQITDNLSWSKGRHLLKAGGLFKAKQFNMNQTIFGRGLLVFNPLMTASSTLTGGNTLASALLGYPLVGQRDAATPWGARNKEVGLYFQDDFKVSGRLTLNLGVRYDLFLPTTEQYDRMTNFDMNTESLILAAQGGASESLVDANTRNFGPHVGLAYALTSDQRTVLRGGYRIAFLPLVTAAPGTAQRLSMNPPFRLNFSTVFNFMTPTVRVSDGLPLNQPDLQNPSGDIVYIPTEQPFPYMQQWNFNIQRALTKALLLDVAYAASRGVHLTGVVNLNQAPPGLTPPGPRSLISPNINNLISLLNRESSFYHSLQIKVERRFAEGFYLLGAYTLAKSIDDGSFTAQGSDASSVSPMDTRNWRLERAVSDFDARHRFVVSYIYELPFGTGKRYLQTSSSVIQGLLGGWQINGITVMQGGLPFTATLATNLANAGPGGAVRPNRIGSGKLPEGQQSIHAWFDKSAFLRPPPGQFGNSGRNVLRGSKFINFDFSVFKNFRLTERVALQFRTEFFNIFNTPNFNLPNPTVDTAQGGVITSARDPRQIQFALKLVF